MAMPDYKDLARRVRSGKIEAEIKAKEDARTYGDFDIPLVIFSTTGNGYVDAWVAGALVGSQVVVKLSEDDDESVVRAVKVLLRRITDMGCLDD